MKLKINKDRVSHIILYNERRGVREQYWGNECYKLMPAKKEFWWFVIFFGWHRYIKAYYRNGKYDIDSMMGSGYCHYTEEEVKDLEGVFIKGDELYTNPIIKIYTGKHLLKEKFFNTSEAAEMFCLEHFPNVNVTFKN